MDVLLLSRIQFAFTVMFHYIYPPLSIGLGLCLVIMEGLYLKTKDPVYHRITKFWVKVFGLIFAIGVATGIVMEFEFGTNWAAYSRYVGDIFGSPLAAEGIFAFFLESGFLSVLLFGWDKVGPGTHFFSTVMVCLGAHMSALWIVVAGSWMQTPAGYHLVGEGLARRAEITDFWAMVFNPSSIDRLTHVVLGCWQAGAGLVLSISAYYLLKGVHQEFAKRSMKIALAAAFAASVLQLGSGHASAKIVSQYQPAKLAAMEGHYNTGKADLYMGGWVDEGRQKVVGPKIPGGLSFLVSSDFHKEIQGLNAFGPQDRPPVQIVFQSFHAMVLLGMLLILLNTLGLVALARGRLFTCRPLLIGFVFSVFAAQAANQLGWVTAEVGRQPWIVYGLLRTADALSKNVTAPMVLGSLIMFTVIYVLLLALFLFLLALKVKHGPEESFEHV